MGARHFIVRQNKGNSVMKLFIFSILMVLAFPASAQSFFTSLPDVPLMSGLTEMEGEALSFDKPGGRILVGVALVDDSISNEELQSYYQRSLPQFGWRSVGPYEYVRGDESLEIFIPEDGANNTEKRLVEITISP